ncbi:MAG TPA: bifunctional demethylmenaquinone methyltransferase/2-methoxy-6-polyprenyl-1,4-benzoquinol methylase UbiE [Coriobacteriia bacterium]|nr:bifunctional demethylmenaquinone methyltransferase/2-methoxy-6-polyprenyl-1,4-benzoquinol methylase UbiE [Coriobacteriia bacterium]
MTDRVPAPGEATTERVRGIFSNIAGQYDTFNMLSSMGIDRTWRNALVKAGEFDAGSRVLDLCAGTGDVGLTIARKAQPSEVVITDFTPEMLEIAEQKAGAYEGRSLLTFKLVDAQEIPFDDNSFDVVTVSFGVRNLPDRQRNFAEVLRVLKPGGRYVILEFSRPSFAPWRGVYHIYLRNVIPALGGLLTHDRESFVYLNDSIRRFPTQPQLAAELRAAGFSAITWKNLSGGIAALHTAVK